MLEPMTARSAASARRRTRLLGLVAVPMAVSLLLAGCGGGDEKEKAGEDKPSAQQTKGGTQLTQIHPLTGRAVKGSLPKNPVMVVKIDNTSSSEPQVGLGSADIVVEELVEGGITRLATLFYSKLPPVVGPVRSARASDIGVIKPANAVLVASGAATVTNGRLKGAHIRTYYEGATGMFREGSRRAPYNLMMRLPELATTMKDVTPPTQNYLPWGKESDFTGSSPATRVSVRFSPATTTLFQYSKHRGKYANVNSHAAAGDRFLADSVLVMQVRETDAGYRDPGGNPVPEANFFGSGTMMLFHEGQVVRGTWSKPKRKSPVTLKTAAGPIKVPAGNVWIELLPAAGPLNGAGSVTFR